MPHIWSCLLSVLFCQKFWIPQACLSPFHAEKFENERWHLFTVPVPFQNLELRVLGLDLDLSKYMLYNFEITKGRSLHK